MRIQLLGPLALALLFVGCAYPRVVSVYDDECQAVVKKMVLDVAEVGRLQACSNNDCLTGIVVQVAGLAVSTVVSGSIVVAGNAVYWLERQRSCRPQQARLEAPAP